MAQKYILLLILICIRITKTYHGRTVLSEIWTKASVNMFCLSVLYLDNVEVLIFIKSVTLGTPFKSPVKYI